MRFIVVLLLAASLVSVCYGQGMVRQCTCAEIEPCKQRAKEIALPCADRCQRFVTVIGGNYQMIRNCVTQKQGLFDATLTCLQTTYSNACARGSPIMVPRRYVTGVEIAAINEISRMLQRTGILQQVTNLMSLGRRFFRCYQSCVSRVVSSCVPDCGLQLPSDNVLVQTAKSCAIRSGINTASAQDLCFCVQRAGIHQLAGICPRIQIFKRK